MVGVNIFEELLQEQKPKLKSYSLFDGEHCTCPNLKGIFERLEPSRTCSSGLLGKQVIPGIKFNGM